MTKTRLDELSAQYSDALNLSSAQIYEKEVVEKFLKEKQRQYEEALAHLKELRSFKDRSLLQQPCYKKLEQFVKEYEDKQKQTSIAEAQKFVNTLQM